MLPGWGKALTKDTGSVINGNNDPKELIQCCQCGDKLGFACGKTLASYSTFFIQACSPAFGLRKKNEVN
jgi:hypothetical protein